MTTNTETLLLVAVIIAIPAVLLWVACAITIRLDKAKADAEYRRGY